MTSRRQFDQAVYIATAAGADGHLDGLLERGKKRAGRPVGSFGTLAYLTAVLLLAMRSQPVNARNIVDQITAMPDEWLPEIGLTGRPYEDDVHGFTRRLAKAVDCSPQRAPHLSEDDRSSRVHALEAYAQALLQPTLVDIPEGATFAIDATDITASERPPTPASDGGSRPQPQGRGIKGPSDASWGRRTSKNPAADDELFYGYFMHSLAVVPEHDSPRATTSGLTTQIAVVTAKADVVEPSLRMIDRQLAHGSIKNLIGDRHYSNKTFDRWAAELINRGINQVADARANEHGARHHDNITYVYGRPFCPATPVTLTEITPPPGIRPTTAAVLEFQAKIDALEAFALVPKSPLDAHGRQRLQCPVGKVGCPIVPNSMALALEHDKPVVTSPPPASANLPICSGKIITVTLDTPEARNLRKLSQNPPYGTARWRRLYSLRTVVERTYSTLKTRVRFQRDSIPYRGLGMTTVIVAAHVAASNLAALTSWHDNTGGAQDHPLLDGHNARVRNRTHEKRRAAAAKRSGR